MAEPDSRPLAAILAAGLLCGLMDITAAFVTWVPRGVAPARILQSISSGLLGPAAFQGGAASASLGLALHFLIALSWGTVFYLASRKIPALTQRAVLYGAVYGVFVYTVMYWVVMPLSRVHRGHFSIVNAVVAIVTHIVCVGLPIALMVRRYSRPSALTSRARA